MSGFSQMTHFVSALAFPLKGVEKLLLLSLAQNFLGGHIAFLFWPE